MGQRPSVRRGDARIGRDRVELAHAAGREHHCARRHRPGLSAGEHRDAHRASPAGEDRGDLGVLQQLDQRVRANHLREGVDQRGPGAVAPGVDDPGPRMRRLEPEPEPAVGATVEPGAQGQKLVNPAWAFTCEDANGFWIGQPVARRHGVRGVLAGAVARPECHGDAALGPGTGAVGEGFLGEDDGLLAFGSEPPRGPQAGDARADDDGAGRGHDGNIRRKRRNEGTAERGARRTCRCAEKRLGTNARSVARSGCEGHPTLTRNLWRVTLDRGRIGADRRPQKASRAQCRDNA